MHHYFSFFKLINYFWLCWVFTVVQAFSSGGKQGFIVVLLNAVTSPLCSSVSKASACNAGDLDSISRSGRSPGEGNGNPCHYSCLENPMDRGAWQATVHGVSKSWTRPKRVSTQSITEERMLFSVSISFPLRG